MTRFQDSILRRNLPISIFEELCSLWRQLVAMGDNEGILITQAEILSEIPNAKAPLTKEKFSLLLSSEFSALLRAIFDTNTLCYRVSISWDLEVIADFIDYLRQNLPPTSVTRDKLSSFSNHQSLLISPVQNFLINKLVNILAADSLVESQKRYTNAAVCQPVEDALRQQIAQEKLLNQVIAQIRQSLDLSSILQTAVRELRSFLQVDRLVIYEFEQGNASNSKHFKSSIRRGYVTYESRVSQSIPSLLNVVAEDNCFERIPHYQEKYRQGSIVAIEDIETAYSSSFCLIKFLEKYWIKAKLIAPIVINENLWGLLIAHQCFKKREWFNSEKNFLGQIGEHLAVAIYQAQLYAQVQEQKNTFEQRVIARTQELRDTLVASQAANHSKSEFLGNMSHELRTPLTCIIGLSATLLHWYGESKSLPLEKQMQYLQTIQDSGKNLLTIINEILEYSKLEAGKYVLSIQEFSLQKVAHNVYERLQGEAVKRQINLELEFKVESQNVNFFADSERIQQILYHLLNNALKFTTEGGKVILRIWREANQAIFQVEDTGIGIAQDQISLLFESFQQLESSRRRIYGGTGLGLALTKQLVELHGGTIEVESVLKQGSIFTVRLPNQPQRQLKSSKKSKTDKSYLMSNRSIVLIESNEEIATLISELLTAANHQFIWLMDSTTAIKKIELLEPTILILDQDLADAYKISETLKASTNTKSIKVLLLSHQISSTDWEDISQRGIDDYLLKPIQPNLLLKRINALMSSDDNQRDNKM
ncbi:MAG TPA: hybrid sensor histidine kinase/response regulator [Cyanothece sp. UBA12306]|nr:hybrid sensor histidine kinase/response regulator [Cyanothece sp. UBA12306]